MAQFLGVSYERPKEQMSTFIQALLDIKFNHRSELIFYSVLFLRNVHERFLNNLSPGQKCHQRYLKLPGENLAS